MRGRTRLTVVVPTASESGARKARLLLRLAAGFPLVAVGACEWLAEPEPEAYRPPAAGADEQPAGEALGEAPHMLALAREIPGFGGYWYEHESAPAPGADGADNRPGGGRLVIALTEAGAGSFPVARRAVLASNRTRVVTLCADIVDFPTAWGDSGAPVFKYYSYGNAQFRGIVFGMTDSVRGWGGVHEKGVFQDLEQIQWDLGRTFTVEDRSLEVRIIGRDLVPQGEQCTWRSETQGVPPFHYEWSGILHGSDSTITGVAEESGWLRLTITDPLDRSAHDSLEVTVGGGPSCTNRGGGDTIVFEVPPPRGS